MSKVVKSTRHAGVWRMARAKMIVPEARRRSIGWPARFGNTNPSRPGEAKRSRWSPSMSCRERRDGDRPYRRRRVLGCFADPLPRLQTDQLLGHPHLAGPQIEPGPSQPDQLAPAHPASRLPDRSAPDTAPECASARSTASTHDRNTHLPFRAPEAAATRSHGLARIFCFSTATWSTRRRVR